NNLNIILKPSPIPQALTPENSFNPKKFFQLCGMTKKSPKEIKDAFCILDNDRSGFIEEDELKYFLQRFSPGARVLTAAETKSFLSAADDDNDGKIGVDGEELFHNYIQYKQQKKPHAV
uniref:Parvalbumin n=1 Tax=Erpetoichthys calabaricus TaxID=27687 RepID=A0A8C4TFN1_ERPCA